MLQSVVKVIPRLQLPTKVLLPSASRAGGTRTYASSSHKSGSTPASADKNAIDRSAHDAWQEFERTRPVRPKLETARQVWNEVMHNRLYAKETIGAELIDLFRPKNRRRFPRTF